MHSLSTSNLRGCFINTSMEQISKLYAISNPLLDEKFEAELKIASGRANANNSSSKNTSWKDDRVEDRQGVHQYFTNYVTQFPWSKEYPDVNMVPLIHGTNKETVWNLCQNGFSSLALVDDGWYGKGMYFTSNASYASKYSRDDQKIYIVCSCILGNYYPAIESPQSKSDALSGRPCKTGYHSNVVLVNKKGMPYKTSEEKPFTEVVLFDESQIVPRYVVYLDKEKLPRDRKKTKTKKTKIRAHQRRPTDIAGSDSDEEVVSEDEEFLSGRKMWGSVIGKGHVQGTVEEENKRLAGELRQLKTLMEKESQIRKQVKKNSGIRIQSMAAPSISSIPSAREIALESRVFE
eukprot:CAMPEP_0168525612 /NCGR_PEP_ID=MMETSP0405-20121227/11416_1 /TAXON_ID=498012 /ORGANISM="Trichosphaerium sp, Strain Am-I-7 wt" /LENGTH=347 /DNA_ID=CAMNT_0008548177 /DNA_START=72 /DNA_END=1112 /DNA_ORIENTATION=+